MTKDGYILTLHRIPSYEAPPRVVFLQHGLMSSSADWVLTGPDHALAFLLADAGYDVWMGNFRGNTYSRHHKEQDISPAKYWVGLFLRMCFLVEDVSRVLPGTSMLSMICRQC